MLDKYKNRKTAAILLTPVVLMVLVFAAFTFSQGSIVDSSKQEEITFYHVTDGAYSYDKFQDNFDQNYAGVHGDTARVGNYEFILDPQESNAAYGSYGSDSCFAVPRVERRGQVVDDYSLQENPIVRYSSWVEKEGTDNRVQQYGDIEARFANPFYMENAVAWGTYYGVQQCYGPFNRYNLDVNFDQISMEAEAPENVTEGEPVKVDVRFENGWKPLKADLNGEACISDKYCSEFSKEDVSVPVGGTTVTVEAAKPASNFTGEVSVDMGGSLGMDMSSFQTKNVVTDCDGDGTKEDASQCDVVQIAKLEGDQVVNVVPEQEEPPLGLGMVEKILSSLWKILTYG